MKKAGYQIEMSIKAATGLLPVSAASPSMDHEHGTVCHPILEHRIATTVPVLLQASSQGPPVSAVVYATADWFLSIVRPAPL